MGVTLMLSHLGQWAHEQLYQQVGAVVVAASLKAEDLE